jgi:hypothetical protein
MMCTSTFGARRADRRRGIAIADRLREAINAIPMSEHGTRVYWLPPDDYDVLVRLMSTLKVWHPGRRRMVRTNCAFTNPREPGVNLVFKSHTVLRGQG